MIRQNIDGIALAIIVLILLSVQSARAMRASRVTMAPMDFHVICTNRAVPHPLVRLPHLRTPHLHLRLR